MPARSPRALRKTPEVHPPVNFILEIRRNFMKIIGILGNAQEFLGNRMNSREPFALNYTNTGTVSNKGAFVGVAGDRRVSRSGHARTGLGVGGGGTNPSSSCTSDRGFIVYIYY